MVRIIRAAQEAILPNISWSENRLAGQREARAFGVWDRVTCDTRVARAGYGRQEWTNPAERIATERVANANPFSLRSYWRGHPRQHVDHQKLAVPNDAGVQGAVQSNESASGQKRLCLDVIESRAVPNRLHISGRLPCLGEMRQFRCRDSSPRKCQLLFLKHPKGEAELVRRLILNWTYNRETFITEK